MPHVYVVPCHCFELYCLQAQKIKSKHVIFSGGGEGGGVVLKKEETVVFGSLPD